MLPKCKQPHPQDKEVKNKKDETGSSTPKAKKCGSKGERFMKLACIHISSTFEKY